ncbi:MAG: DUF493 domain-containing protein [Pseudomonadales bacterium]|nr:DUF493 domain-containing protein [Pseudomonadales bacterium]
MSSDSDQQDVEAPRIEFPCLYPIKIIGISEGEFELEVVEVVERHTGKIDAELIKIRNSSKSNYISVTVTIAATGEEQLQNIFQDLKAVSKVKMVL